MMIISLLSLADHSILKPKGCLVRDWNPGSKISRSLMSGYFSPVRVWPIKGATSAKVEVRGCQSFTSASAFSSILLALFLASVLDPSFYSLILLIIWFSKKINHWASWDRSSILFSNLWDCKTFYSHHPYTQTHTFTHTFKRDLQFNWLFLHTLTIFSLYNARYPLNLLWIWTTVKREFSYHFIQYIQSIFLFFTSHNR